MRITKLIIIFLTSMSLYAHDVDYIGTRSNPIPLKGGIFDNLKSITIYLYQDKGFEITDNDKLILQGIFTDEGDYIGYSNHVAVSAKVHVEINGHRQTCLQTTLYEPEIYKYKTDWFCHS